MGPKLGPGHLCRVCHETPLNNLPFEEEEALPHHLTLDALEKSAESCAMCFLILWAAGCSLVDLGGMVTFIPNIELCSGAKVCARATESNYKDFCCIRSFESGAAMVDFSKRSCVADYRPPLQTDPRKLFPHGRMMRDGVEKPIRPWLFGNWFKSGFVNNKQLLMIGLGVRLATSSKIEDAVHCSEYGIVLRGTFLRFRTDDDLDFLPGRVRSADSGSSFAFNKLRGWLDLCNKHHACVSVDAPKPLPARVLDVATSQNVVFLRETAGQQGKYLALSHCWGSTHRLILTKANIGTFKDGIPLSDIPKTFRDAVQIAKELDVPYLWIDSLCIIQDDTADWEEEASRMGDVYAGSYLTIAALSANDDSSGCFPDPATRYNEPFVSTDVRSTGRRCLNFAAPVFKFNESNGQKIQSYMSRCIFATEEVTDHENNHTGWVFITPEWMPPSTKNEPKTYLVGEFGGQFDPIADESLSKRGWALQERLLSPRTIHYGRTEMYWECQLCVFAEDGADLRRTFPKADDLFTSYPEENSRGWWWQRLVEQYTTRKLTRDSDKLLSDNLYSLEA